MADDDIEPSVANGTIVKEGELAETCLLVEKPDAEFNKKVQGMALTRLGRQTSEPAGSTPSQVESPSGLTRQLSRHTKGDDNTSPHSLSSYASRLQNSGTEGGRARSRISLNLTERQASPLRRQVSQSKRSFSPDKKSPTAAKNVDLVNDADSDCSCMRKSSKGSKISKSSKVSGKQGGALQVRLMPHDIKEVQGMLDNESSASSNGSFTVPPPTGFCSPHNRSIELLATLLDSNRFQTMIGFLIMINAVLMGLELDQHELAEPSPVKLSFLTTPHIPQGIFDAFEFGFFIIFALELIMRFVVHRCAMLREFSTYIDCAALAPIVLLFVFDVESSKQLTLLRIFRLLKLCRISRLIRLSRELSVLVRSIASSLRSLLWIGVLLLIVVYCAAITCTMLIGHDERFLPTNEQIMLYEDTYRVQVNIDRYWGSTIRSMVTLFEIFTLDDWKNRSRAVIETHAPVMMFFFVTFIFITTFGLLNLLMGTIVDHSVNAHKEAEEECKKELEKVLQDEHKQMLLVALKLFSMIDKDGNGKLSASELQKFSKENTVVDFFGDDMALAKVDIDYEELVDMCMNIAEAWGADADTDSEDAPGITIEEFAGAATRLRGNARSRDLLSVHVLVKSTLGRVHECEKNLASQDKKLDKIIELLGKAFDDTSRNTRYADGGMTYQRRRPSALSVTDSHRSHDDATATKQPFTIESEGSSITPDSPHDPAMQSKSSRVQSRDSLPSNWDILRSRSYSKHDVERNTSETKDDSRYRRLSRTKSGISVLSEKSASRVRSPAEARSGTRCNSIKSAIPGDKVSNFVEQIMTSLPEFANTASGAAIRNYNTRRTSTSTRSRNRHHSIDAASIVPQEHVDGSDRSGGKSSPASPKLQLLQSAVRRMKRASSQSAVGLSQESPAKHEDAELVKREEKSRRLVRCNTMPTQIPAQRRRHSAPHDCPSPLPGVPHQLD